jgi:predicted transcriptional regulator
MESLMQDASVKKEARRLVEDLPEDATWDDLMYRIYVRQAIEVGIRDAEEGRVVSVDEVRARFGLPK